MKVVLLAGGLGTRLAEFTDVIPKPMVPVGDHPVLWHLMKYYASFGHNDFHVALGYKAQVVKEYFLNYHALNSDFTVNLGTGVVNHHSVQPVDWKVTLVDTGLHSMTGGRVKRMRAFLGNEPFLLTYGDGLSNVDINALIAFHQSHGKMVTVTAVHPGARFGELGLAGSSVTAFKEKPQMGNGWINGGFFVVEPRFLDLIVGDDAVLEKEPLEQAAAIGELMAYQHEGFWQCMDTVRDRNVLEELWASNRAPWRVWQDL